MNSEIEAAVADAMGDEHLVQVHVYAPLRRAKDRTLWIDVIYTSYETGPDGRTMQTIVSAIDTIVQGSDMLPVVNFVADADMPAVAAE